MCDVRIRLFAFVLCCLVPASFGRAFVSRRFCDANQFLDVQRDACRNCSTTCSTPNHIIRRTCSTFADSVCGPFFEFRPPPSQQDEDGAGRRKGVMQRLQRKNEMRRKQQQQQQQQQQSSLLRRQKGTTDDWSLLANDTEYDGEEYSGRPFAFLLPPPPLPPQPAAVAPDSEPDFERWCCSAGIGVLSIVICASLICIVIAAMVTWIVRRRVLRNRKSLPGPISVDKRVMHLELQLHRNWERRASGAAGGMTLGSSQPIGGNDYVKDELRRALMWNRNTWNTTPV